MTKVKLKKCNLCCFEHATYDVFEADGSDYYIIEYEVRFGKDKSNKTYSLMSKGYYPDGGIALIIDGKMLYSFGKECFITGYCPINIVKN